MVELRPEWDYLQLLAFPHVSTGVGKRIVNKLDWD
jgi:hypothetical protein